MDSLGVIIRMRRQVAKLGLREVARQVGISPSYMSDIELDRRQPADPVLREIGRVLGLDADDLLCRAGRLAPATKEYLQRHPRLIVLVNRIAARGLPDEVLRGLERFVDDHT